MAKLSEKELSEWENKRDLNAEPAPARWVSLT
jgi:hypothetical protein